MLDQLPDRYRRTLIDAGITEPQDALAAGEDGLVALDGIGAKSARLILEVAAQMAPEPEPPEPPEPGRQMELTPAPEPEPDELEGITPELAETHTEAAEEAQPAPIEGSRPVIVRLVGRSAAVLAGRVIYQNEARQTPFHQFRQAVSQYPAGTFQVRLPGDSTFREA